MGIEEMEALRSKKSRILQKIADYRTRKNVLPTEPRFVRQWVERQLNELGWGESPYQFSAEQTVSICDKLATLLREKVKAVASEAASGRGSVAATTIKMMDACREALAIKPTTPSPAWVHTAMAALIDENENPRILQAEYLLIARWIKMEIDINISLLTKLFGEV